MKKENNGYAGRIPRGGSAYTDAVYNGGSKTGEKSVITGDDLRNGGGRKNGRK